MIKLRKILLSLALVAPLGFAACNGSSTVTGPADPLASVTQDTTVKAPAPSPTSDPNTTLCGIGMQGSGGRAEDGTCQ